MNHASQGATALLALLAATAAQAQLFKYEIQTLSITDLGTLGGDEAVAYDVNDLNEVVGWAKNTTTGSQAFLHRNGAMQGVLGSASVYPSSARGINNSSLIVGSYTMPNGPFAQSRAYRFDPGTSTFVTLLNPEWTSYAAANAINEEGRIVGRMVRDTLQCASDYMAVQWWHAFAPDTAIFCADPGDVTVTANDLNDSNLMVGSVGSPEVRAFVWNGALQLVPLPQGTCESNGQGINESGAVVGRAKRCDDGNYRAFYWNGSAVNPTLLGTLPGGTQSEAYDVNDQRFVSGYSRAGILAGGGFNVVWRDRGFIWHTHFGMVALPTLPGVTASASNCRANGLGNRDAASGIVRIAGYCTNATGKLRAVRWDIVVGTTFHVVPPL